MQVSRPRAGRPLNLSLPGLTWKKTSRSFLCKFGVAEARCKPSSFEPLIADLDAMVNAGDELSATFRLSIGLTFIFPNITP
jgi:hypothetical protein